MHFFDCGPAAEARRRLEERTSRVQPNGMPIGMGIFRNNTFGSHGNGVSRTDYFVLIAEGEAFARTEAEDRVPLTAGQAVFWRKGEWFALEILAGPCEWLAVQGDHVDPYDLCGVPRDASSDPIAEEG